MKFARTLSLLVLPVQILSSCTNCEKKVESNLGAGDVSELGANCRVQNKKIKKNHDSVFDISEVIDNYSSLCSAVHPSHIKYSNTDYLVFDSSIRFLSDTFFNTAKIDYATFKEWADFSYCRFDTDVEFDFDTIQSFGLSGASIHRNIFFEGTQFNKNAYFNNLELGDSAKMFFLDTTLPDSLFFSNIIKIPSEIDLTIANYKSPGRYDCHDNYNKHNIFLYQTDVSKLHFNYKFFNLIFEDNMHKTHILEDERIAMYESVLKNFKDRGQLESYRLLDLEYQKYKWGKPYFHWLWWLPFIWWNYGYTKELIFLWTIGLLLVFTFINYFCLEYLNEKVYKVDFNSAMPKSGPSILRKLWHSFLYTSSIFFRLNLKSENFKFNRAWYAAYILIINILGIICMAYLANYVIQK
jgi:hypothetical protein